MGKDDTVGLSRRRFLQNTAVTLTGLAVAAYVPDLPLSESTAAAADTAAPLITIEQKPLIKVLRWGGFLKSDEDIWLANTRRWEKLTGGRVITDIVPFNDVRPNAAMEATLGTGHDIVVGWFDDPHLYPDKLLELTDLAEYLGSKYGGWYPVCETYGRSSRTNQWIALPVGCSGQCINYRQRWVRDAGFETMPTDINGFLRCCKALKAKGHPTGFALGHAVADANAWCHWWLWSFGGKAVEADGRTIAINNQETLLALETARELFATMITGVDTWLDPHNNREFLAGNISVTNNGSSIAYAAQGKNPDIDADLAVINFPIGPVGRPAELSALSQAFIFRHTPMPNAARHYLRFMFEEEQYGSWISGSSGYICQSLKKFHDTPGWVQNPKITPYRECIKRMRSNGHAGPLGTASAAAMSEFVIVDMISDVCTGNKTPRTAALRAEKRLSRLYV
ncbi:MAG: ABC transporter substrate-binding protein [Proteobacteria bacterium]|nr:ABC transporter substrate-binding protein [Pseudomonadota bacterium]MBU4297332.1 ABC transporter substrate-binding protein [Pseudomonadota bacterium]MCG2747766.1 ABC transporter substrate-binding protein [Desulfobulbaceae bacterium]